MTSTKRIAILGVGAMGLRLARNLLATRYPVTVYNRTAARTEPLRSLGATVARTPHEAAAQADIVLASVTDDEASRQIWLEPETGALAGLQAGAIAIEASTLTLDWVLEWFAACNSQKVTCLDAPVVGSRPQAEAKALIALVGGEADSLARATPILTAAGIATIYHLGSIGRGMALKLAVNALFGIQVAALAESLAALASQGIAPTDALACLVKLPVLSPAAAGAGHLIATQQHAPLFPLALATKDLGYFCQAAGNGGNTPVATPVRALYQQAIAAGYGRDNITGIACFLPEAGSVH